MGMINRVKNFNEFTLNENIPSNNTPEGYIIMLLEKMKKVVDNIFNNSNVDSFDKSTKSDSDMNVNDINLSLVDLSISKGSPTRKYLKFILNNDDYRYDFSITIPLEGTVDKSDINSIKDIKICNINVKKIDLENDSMHLIGEFDDKFEIINFNEDMIIDMVLKTDSIFDEDSTDMASLDYETNTTEPTEGDISIEYEEEEEEEEDKNDEKEDENN